MIREYKFSVPATYKYTILANNEQKARKILREHFEFCDGDNLMPYKGELYIDPKDYLNATLEGVTQ